MRFLKEAKEDWIKLEKHLASNPYIDAGYYINLFKKFNQRLQGSEKDIYYWLKKDPVDLADRLDELDVIPSKSQAKKSDKVSGSKLVAENDFYSIYKITSHKASCLYGANTEWCITSSDDSWWRREYPYYDFYFIISKYPDRSRWDKIAMQVRGDDITFWDSLDNAFSKLPRQLREYFIGMPTFNGIDILKYVVELPAHTDAIEKLKKALESGKITQQEYDNMMLEYS